MTGTEYSEPSVWPGLPTARRCDIIGGVAAEVSDSAAELVRLCRSEQRTDDAETVASELLPLCAALKFVGRRGAAILRPRRLGPRGRPAWLWGVRSTVSRVPLGRVLILGTWNYPLLLPGVQAAQALAAGNEVLLKPAAGSESATRCLAGCFQAAGVPTAAIQVLDSSPQAAIDAIDAGVDLVVLTGSALTGRRVMTQAASKLTPVIMELSGCDAVIALPTADISRLAAAIDFGLNFNAGATCIGPRRLIVEAGFAEQVLGELDRRLASREAQIVHRVARESVADLIDRAITAGAVDRGGRYDAGQLRASGRLAPIVLDQVSPDAEIASADLFAPVLSVIRVDRIERAAEIVNRCRYRLAASVFGTPAEARSMANALAVGTVTINDLIVPTADPRIPFGGRGDSGFGVTRGDEGLLAMSAIKVIGERRGRVAPHLSSRKESDSETLSGYLEFAHGGSWGRRLSGLRRMIASVKTFQGSSRVSRESNR